MHVLVVFVYCVGYCFSNQTWIVMCVFISSNDINNFVWRKGVVLHKVWITWQLSLTLTAGHLFMSISLVLENVISACKCLKLSKTLLTCSLAFYVVYLLYMLLLGHSYIAHFMCLNHTYYHYDIDILLSSGVFIIKIATITLIYCTFLVH